MIIDVNDFNADFIADVFLPNDGDDDELGFAHCIIVLQRNVSLSFCVWNANGFPSSLSYCCCFKEALFNSNMDCGCCCCCCCCFSDRRMMLMMRRQRLYHYCPVVSTCISNKPMMMMIFPNLPLMQPQLLMMLLPKQQPMMTMTMLMQLQYH